MNSEKKIMAFVRLGEIIRKFAVDSTSNSILKEATIKASQSNGWFTQENLRLAIESIGNMLMEEKIRKWVLNYKLEIANNELAIKKLKSIGVIMAGNIPLVGFHDFFCVLMSENIFAGKLSSEDEHLLPAVAKILMEIEPAFANRIHFTNQLINQSTNVSAFIATGSNNSAKYFEYYFRKYPHIIRRNKNAIAILDGTEKEKDLKNLGKDIFQYFGLGCRNVSNIFIPKNYDLNKFFAAIEDFGDVINHNKYYNNYNYYKCIYLLNQSIFLDNGFLILKEDERIASPVSTLHYERYADISALIKKNSLLKEQIQCVVSVSSMIPLINEQGMNGLMFGRTQSPELWDYADGVDTMEFLLSL
ncbi:MAG: acyl-CoA reductase [Bacteroidota bacterium]